MTRGARPTQLSQIREWQRVWRRFRKDRMSLVGLSPTKDIRSVGKRVPRPSGDVIMDSAVSRFARNKVGEWNGTVCTCVRVA